MQDLITLIFGICAVALLIGPLLALGTLAIIGMGIYSVVRLCYDAWSHMGSVHKAGR